MFKNLLKKTKPLKLGRWGVTYESQVLEKRINWANHDHCGGDLCSKKELIEIKTVVKIPNKKRTVDEMKYEEIYPFVM